MQTAESTTSQSNSPIAAWSRGADRLYMSWAKSRAFRMIHRSWFAQFGLLAVVFGLMRLLMTSLAKYPEDIYLDSFIGNGLFAKPREAVIVLALSALLFASSRRLHWRRLGGRWARVSAFVLLLLLFWGVAGVGFNYYTNQAYLADRVLILTLVLLSARWPAFSLPAVAYCMLFFGQVGLSAGDLETTDKLALLYANYAVVSWVLLRTAFPMRARALPWFLLALMIAAYFAPGWAKLTVSGELEPTAWLLHDPLHCLVATGHAHGWMSWWDRQQVGELVSFLAGFSPLMAAFTLLAELAAPFLGLSRRLAPLWLVLVIGMHAGIFAFTGILFWKWVCVDMLLIWGLLSLRPQRGRQRWLRVVAFAALIACFPLYAKPKFLGWLDSNVSETYFVEVVAEDGHTYRVQQKDFSPYDITFEQGAFHYANPGPVVNDVWGNAYSYELGRRMNETTNAASMQSLIRKEGRVLYHEKKAATLDSFLQQYFRNANARGDSMEWLEAVGPPHHVQTRSGGDRYDFQTRVKRVQLRFVRTFFDGEHIVTLDDHVVREVVVE
ncbi:MAG: hypothetical protein IPK87_11285 [Planctomycetes bacterium]|nr:hypothetical protein [Planctomycetota bacterium]